MKLLKLLALYIGCFLFPSPFAAKPQLPSKCEAFRPKLLLNFTVMQADLDDLISPPKKKASSWGQDGPSTNLYWEVFSDRSGNTVYEGPSESSYACGTLDFNEELRIASIKNGFALVYSEKQNGTQYPTISRRAEVKGWVSMHHLLLWRDCPTNEYGIYNKALIVGNIDKLKNDAHIGNYYTNPVTQEGKNNLRSTGQFFFVMKKDIESGLVLLAKSRACPYWRRGLTPLGRLQKYPKIHVSTGEESSGSGTDSKQGLRPGHRRERKPEMPPCNSHADWHFLRPTERFPEVPVIGREHLRQLEKIQVVVPSRRDGPISAGASRG